MFEIRLSQAVSIALAIMLILPGAAVRAAEPTPSAMPEPIERASADDCAIIVELGRKQLNWGEKPPAAAFFAEWPGANGGTYLEECPWKQLGVAAPRSASQVSDKSFFITRPIYSGRRSTSATVKFEYRDASPSAIGKQVFSHRQTCSFEKDEQGWLLMECKTDFIT